MTHEELLSAIDVQIITAPPFALGGYTRFLHSLRAVVELHKPYQGYVEEEKTCQVCRSNQWAVVYPCQTIQAIEKELG